MSANASKGKIIRLEDVRRARVQPTQPPPLDPDAILQRITRAKAAPTAEERELATTLVLEDCAMLVRLMTVVAPELAALKQRIRIFAAQNSDLGTINAVLLARAGGEVRMPAKWFADFEVDGGYEVTEEGDEVVIRATVDGPADSGVGSESATQQTEDDGGAGSGS